ncbi:hypothetical protein IJL65_04105 [bacterium]|nr:hypothetical protein [bacterium]
METPVFSLNPSLHSNGIVGMGILMLIMVLTYLRAKPTRDNNVLKSCFAVITIITVVWFALSHVSVSRFIIVIITLQIFLLFYSSIFLKNQPPYCHFKLRKSVIVILDALVSFAGAGVCGEILCNEPNNWEMALSISCIGLSIITLIIGIIVFDQYYVSGSGNIMEDEEERFYFISQETMEKMYGIPYDILVDRETKVQYICKGRWWNRTPETPILDSDGKPILYTGIYLEMSKERAMESFERFRRKYIDNN